MSSPVITSCLHMNEGSKPKEDSIAIHQDAYMYVGKPKAGEEIQYQFQIRRFGWIQMIKGEIMLGDHSLKVGDGASMAEESILKIKAITDAEFLFFDLA